MIHELWTRGDQSLMILPGTLPLDAASVRNELLRYLPETWSGVVDADIDGPESRPYQIDGNVPMLGKYTASRRVARSIFVGSAPSVTAQSVRGVEEVRIRLATVQPGEQVAIFGDALKRMSNQLTYLYTDGSRYWYDTCPTVNRLARDRAQIIAEEIVGQEIVTRLKKEPRTRDFDGVHVAPLQSSDVIDEPQTRIVVLHPNHTHKRNNGESDALRFAKEILESRGNSPRIYRNMLVYIAADQGDAEALKEAVREHLAWQSIQGEEEQLNLDAQQRRQVQAQLARTRETVEQRLKEAYSWLLMPYQPEPIGEIEWQTARISGNDSFYLRAARKLHQSEALIPAWAPNNLRMELDRFNLWGEQNHIGLKQLWEYFARYCYLPRLVDDSVLQQAVRDGISSNEAPFAYATSVAADGRYVGLAFRRSSSIYFDSDSVLVHPDAAQRQLAEERAKEEAKKAAADANTTERVVQRGERETDVFIPEIPIAPPPPLTRYYGAVSIDSQRAYREMGLIVEEVIQRLTSLTGCDVDIQLEITARRPDGFDEATVRTISENSRTLKFNTHEFE